MYFDKNLKRVRFDDLKRASEDVSYQSALMEELLADGEQVWLFVLYYRQAAKFISAAVNGKIQGKPEYQTICSSPMAGLSKKN